MTDERFDLNNRTIIVTGGGSGIGKTYSTVLASAGANVVIADIAGDEGQAVADDISSNVRRAVAITTDISSEDDTAAMAEMAMSTFGRIDGLINNASLMSTLERKPWHEIDITEWDRVMEVNLKGMFLCCRAVYRHMKEQGKGKIVNISSGRVWKGTAERLHYTASKAGVIGFTRTLAREVGDDNICVNAISPGFTESETQMATSTPEYLESRKVAYQKRSLKRAQLPDDLVGAVMFLCSDASDFITGQTINIDGGDAMH